MRQEAADRLAADASGLDETGSPKTADVPRHERLRQPDVVDELGDGGLGVGEPLHDAQPVDVGEGLVESAQGAELLGLVEDGRDRAANAGSGRGQGAAPFRCGQSRRINDGLYQSTLMRWGMSSPARAAPPWFPPFTHALRTRREMKEQWSRSMPFAANWGLHPGSDRVYHAWCA